MSDTQATANSDGTEGKDNGVDTDRWLEDMQHWTYVAGRMQQMLLRYQLDTMDDPESWERSRKMGAAMLDSMATEKGGSETWSEMMGRLADPAEFMALQSDLASKQFDIWSSLWSGKLFPEVGESHAKDRRFSNEAWEKHPLFDALRRCYQLTSETLLDWVESADGIDDDEREKLQFNMRGALDAMAPTNFAALNPDVIERAVETRGESLLQGLENLLNDLKQGKMTQTTPGAFSLGENIATTPGKVVHRTELYELIQYTPTTDKVWPTPLVIIPPFINRFYILDLTEEKSFVRHALDSGIPVFMVSWKSADASLGDTDFEDYALAQIDAIDTARTLTESEAVHTIGYCVSGTILAATLALLTARGEADKVKSATFFTAQVDFEDAGDLKAFLSDEHLAMVKTLSEPGYLDGRYMAATFNALRGKDLIWNYVVDNYMMGKPYKPFDLLHWNSHTTNIPAKFHSTYLEELYRKNRLVEPGGITIDGTPIDLSTIKTPSYVQAGKLDHIAPAESVWKITRYLSGPLRFILAGSGHIAGVVNPPAKKKYQYWTNPKGPCDSFEAFVEGAEETPGSWWPDWTKWITGFDDEQVKVSKGYNPNRKATKTYGDAPGDYVQQD